MNTKTQNGNLGLYLVIAVLVVAVAFFAFSGSRTATLSKAEGTSAAIGYNSAVCKEVIRADGSREDLGCKHNLFTNLGKNITRDLLMLGSVAAVTAIGVSNQTTSQAATDTSLGGEYAACGLSRAAGSVAIQPISVGNFSVSKVFTSSCDSTPVNGTGLYNATSGNVLFAETTFTTATLQTNDQINVTWFIWVSGS